MNVEDSIRIIELMKPLGYVATGTANDADLVILNTCHIREKATDKLYSELGVIRDLKNSTKSNMVIVAAGCVSQAEGDEIFRRAPYVDIVIGPQAYANLPEMVSQTTRDGIKHLINLDFEAKNKFDKLPEETAAQGITAFLTIQEGCDKFCTFCVVPYTRGAEYSRPVSDIYREAMNLAASGTKEITLLGQNVTSYKGESIEGWYDIVQLIKTIASINGIERIRYTTSHPRDISDELINLHATEPKLMPFLHLPVQSGSDKILKMMNRKHGHNKYLDIIQKFRTMRPDMAFSSDFIVGFPGEDDEDFEQTMKLVEYVKFSQCFSFKYSIRPGTPAAAHEQQIDEKIKSERLQKLQNLLTDQQRTYNKSFIGKTVEVLFEKPGRHPGQAVGKTPYMQGVHVNGAEEYIGSIKKVKIVDIHTNSMVGELI